MSESILENKIVETFSLLSGQKIFLTGGTGFFGKSFLDLILRYNNHCHFEVLILTREPNTFLKKYPEFSNLKQIRYLKGDIIDFQFPNERFDQILHFATPADAAMNINSPLEMTKIIVEGMKHILDFAIEAKVKNFLLTSSGAVYGPQPPTITHIKESYTGAPVTTAVDAAYGASKRYAEFLGCAFSNQHGFEFKIARCFAFTGKYLDQSGSFAIANFIKNATEKTDIEIKGDGTPFRSYLYADDLIVWLLQILRNGTRNQAYNVGSDQDLNIKSLAQTVADTLNPKIQIQILQTPKPDAAATRYVPDISKACSELGLKVWTPLTEAIQKSVQLNSKTEN
jgi:nucleoside-diphosphate-sugar epimerase